MEIIDFSTIEFKEIPQQDNPAYEMGLPPCLMVVKAAKRHHVDGVTVMLIEDDHEQEVQPERVTLLGHFYRLRNAEIFAAAFIAIRKIEEG